MNSLSLPLFDVWYVLPTGKHVGIVCKGETALISFVSKLRRPAAIMFDGEHVGRVWKDGDRWNWFYDPEKLV